jgi:hypothetical protein
MSTMDDQIPIEERLDDDDDEEVTPSRTEPQPDSTWVVLGTLVLGLPLAIAVVVLAGRAWYPVLDLAMTEFRVRDVGGSRTPLIGLPGRIGEFPDQGSHPGPLSFYLWAGPYRLFGSSAWALQVAAGIVNLLAVLTALMIGARRGGRSGVAVVAAVTALIIRGFGVELFVEPWNPYAPLLWWLVVLLATWSVLCGDHRLLVVLVAAATFCVQTHVPYTVLCVVLVVIAAVSVSVNTYRADALRRGPLITSLGASGVVVVLLWIPPLIDQVRRSPGNIRMLLSHFTSPGEPAIGLRAGFELTLRHLDPVDGFVRMLSEPGAFLTASFDPDSRIWAGALVLVIWLATVALAAFLRHHVLLRLHAVVGVALVLGVFSMSRIFGKVWYYLTLWAWVTTTLLLLAVVWTLVTAARMHLQSGAGRLVRLAFEAAAVVLLAGAVLGSTFEAADAEPPEAHLSDTLGDLTVPVLATLGQEFDVDDDRFLVTWTDAYFFGSQGYGLVNELERAGFDAGVLEPWRVPVTPYRVLDPADATTGVHLATGIRIDEWRDRDDTRMIAFVEPRTASEQVEYADLRREAIAELRADGLDDLVDLVDSNLFLVSNDPQVSRAAADAMARMLVLGQETAVFLVTPGSAP